MVRRASALIFTSTVLVACGGETNHLGNPILLPASAVSNAIDNASYGARRSKVKLFVASHRNQIHRNIKDKGGEYLSAAMDLARVLPSKRANLRKELFANRELYVQRDIEPLVVALMVHGS